MFLPVVLVDTNDLAIGYFKWSATTPLAVNEFYQLTLVCYRISCTLYTVYCKKNRFVPLEN